MRCTSSARAVQPGPGAALEVIETEVLFQLLMRLFAHPARLDGTHQGAARGAGRQVRKVKLALARGAPLADQPGLGTGQVAVVAPGRAVADPHASHGEAGRQLAPGTLASGHAPPGQSVEHRLGLARLPIRHELASAAGWCH